MSKRLYKLLISFLLGISLLFSFVPASYAQAPLGPWYDQKFEQFYMKVYGDENQNEIFGERYTAAQVQWVLYGFVSVLINAFVEPEAASCLYSQEFNACQEAVSRTGKALVNEKYLAHFRDKTIVDLILEDRSLSAITYFRDVARKFRVIPEAQAQAGPGFGYEALSPIRPLWSAARNITYTLFVIIVLIMAFLIMFRVKLSPQTAITVQSALPKVVIAIILVTFSYAIVGFLVDLMYVVIGLISLFFTAAAGGNNSTQMFVNMTNPPGGVVGMIVAYIQLLIYASIAIVRGTFLSAPEGAVVASAFASSFIVVLILAAIIIISLFIALKTIWMLFKAFVNILMLTILGPFQIAFGTIVPGLSFTSWIRNIIANLAVFPTTSIMFLLAFIFLSSIIHQFFPDEPLHLQFATRELLLPTETVGGWPPLLSIAGGQSGWLLLGASIVVYLFIPKAADIVKSAIEGKPFAFGTAIGEAVGPLALAGLPIQQRIGMSQAAQKAKWESRIKELETPNASDDDLREARQMRRQLAEMDFNNQIRSGMLGQLKNIFK